MSSRLYPLYQKGNPQLRVFLPNFFMKLIRPGPRDPPNHVGFIVSTGMSKYDVQNYLEKIYNVPVVSVSTRIYQGKTKPSRLGYIIKDDDYKVAHVTLPKDFKFEFPDIYPDIKEEEESKDRDKTMKQLEAGYKKIQDRSKLRPDVPGWFTS